MARTMLLDGDIVAFQISADCEVAIQWDDDLWTLHSDGAEAKARLDSYIDDLMEKIDADDVIVALTHHENFRKAILPTYKSNRQNVRKPLCLKALKAHLADEYETFVWPGLEGDDILGILSTSNVIKGEKIIVSIDKDLKGIPGYLYDPKDPDKGIQEISEAEADYWHLYQTLVGDSTDGYSGCPGVGPKTAEKLLGERLGSPWEAVVRAFKKANLSEAEALVQARVARILRAEDYDFKAKKPILWSPPKEKVSGAA